MKLKGRPLPLIAPCHWHYYKNQNVTTSQSGPAVICHLAYGRLILNQATGRRRWQYQALTAWWVFAAVFIAIYYTVRLGYPRRKRIGKSCFRQFAEQVGLFWHHGILGRWYYLFELYDELLRPQARYYLNRFETKGQLYVHLKNRHKQMAMASLGDKLTLHRQSIELGLQSISIHALVKNGAYHPVEQGVPQPPAETPVLPGCDLFIKPVRGKGGQGTESWSYRGGDFYQNAVSDLTLAADALVKRLRQKSGDGALLIQQRLKNHPDLSDLDLGALMTVRIMTILNEEGEVEVTDAAFRMPRHARSAVDNFHAGGIAARVDLETGRIGPATDMGVDIDSDWHRLHPVSGATIAGRLLPDWQAACLMVRHLHTRIFANRLFIGWDVALTPEGPVAVEGNSSPDLDIIQRTQRRPVGQSRFGSLLAMHVHRLGL